jgi:phage terminase large subunit-like protein
LSKAPRAPDDVAEGIDYARDIVTGVIPAGRWVRRACQRFLDDLDRAKQADCPWRFSVKHAQRPLVFAALMVNVKGPRAGFPIELLPFEKWVLVNIFGFVDRITGARRFRQASIWIPRGNGKTTLSAVLALFMTFTEGEGGAEGYAAAVSKDQAKIAFDMAKVMASKNPDFRKQFGVRVNAQTISQAGTGSSFLALSAHAKALDGLNVHFAVLDEIGSHRSAAIYDVMITATGKRLQPLLVSISTATDNATGVGRQVWNYTESVLSGLLSDDQLFGVIYDADPDDDPWAETTWAKANPGWGELVQPDAIRALARQALASPALQAAFKTRHLNTWVSSNSALFDVNAWAACADPGLTLADLRGEPCIAALDMATRTDIAAGVLLFPRPDPEGGETTYLLFSFAWLPEAAVDSERNPLYVQWSEAGALIITPGETTDYETIEDWLRWVGGEFDLRACGYDPYMLMQLSQRLRNDGFPMFEYRSSTLNFSEPTKLLDALMRERRITHNGDPVLAWTISNVVGHYDARSNVYPRKESPEKKIDNAIATIIALGVSIATEKDGGGYIYTDRDLLVF